MELLTSPHNPRVKRWAALKERRQREKTGLYAAEGVLLVREYLDAGAAIQTVLFDTFGAKGEAALELAERAQARGIPVVELTSSVFACVADTDHPQGALAIVRTASATLASALREAIRPAAGADLSAMEGPRSVAAAGCADVVLVADGVRDPGNLGAMLRTAHAVGCRAAIVTDGSVDPYNPKVVRASMGALAHLTVVQAPAKAAAEQLLADGFTLLGADARAVSTLFQTPLQGRVAVAVGAEADGLSAELMDRCAGTFALPMPGGAESLNAGIAASVVLYEALRQRVL